MNINLKNFIKKFIYKFGLDIYRFEPSSSPPKQILSVLKIKNIDIVFDIGANIGQFAKELRSAGYNGEIVSFEPLPKAHVSLKELAKKDKKWKVHDPVAIGDKNKKIKINISENSVSSSLLPMMKKHLSAAETSKYISSEIVNMYKLDSISEKYLNKNSKLFLKIDTQGYEWQVLDGAKESLKRAQGVLCELSLVPLYNEQRLWRDIVDRLDQYGFMLWALQKGFTNSKTGQSLQMDGIFVKKTELKNLLII